MAQPLVLSVDFGQGISDAWSSVATFIPKLIAFLVIMIIGWFVAKFIARLADRLLRKAGFEKVVGRSGISQALKDSQYDGTGIISRIIFFTIMLMVLQMGFGVFGPNPVSDMLRSIVAWLPKAIVACVIVVIAMAVARAVREIITAALGGVSYGRMLGTAAWAFIVGLGAIAALSQAGIATAVTGPVLVAVLATVAGVVIVGVGGGLVMPMRDRWENWLQTAARESASARESVSAYQRGRAHAQAGRPAGTGATQSAQGPSSSAGGGMPGTDSGGGMPGTGSGSSA